jgi:hypothetical protein
MRLIKRLMVVVIGIALLGISGSTAVRAQQDCPDEQKYRAPAFVVEAMIDLRDAHTGQVLSQTKAPIGVVEAWSCISGADLDQVQQQGVRDVIAQFARQRKP